MFHTVNLTFSNASNKEAYNCKKVLGSKDCWFLFLNW
jgi:hypothetical protein